MGQKEKIRRKEK